MIRETGNAARSVLPVVVLPKSPRRKLNARTTDLLVRTFSSAATRKEGGERKACDIDATILISLCENESLWIGKCGLKNVV